LPRHFTGTMLWLVLLAFAASAGGQAAPAASENGVQQQTSYQNMTPEQRAASTRAFLGLGAVPDKAAAARGEPLFEQSCAVCHGRQARGATGPSLITSDEVLGDDHGEHLVAFLRKGRPDKGMPAYAAGPDSDLKDIAEFLHLEVEEIANRGAYRVLNIVVGNAAKGQEYVTGHCLNCHAQSEFAHIATRFRSPDQLQRGWIWPSRTANPALAITASVKTPDGAAISGRVTELSDFRIAIVDADGKTHAIERGPGVDVRLTDPLAAHEQIILTLQNGDIHDVTAYLETLK
jgi:cytochrome c oxidase cbb3-type subunit III